MAQRVLVTGGAGHLGREVCKALAEAGFETRAVDRVYRKGLPVPLDVLDLLDGPAVYRHVEGCDAIVHLANHPSAYSRLPQQQIYAENVTMDINVFQAAAEVGVQKLIFASSVQAFSGTRTDEDIDKPSCLAYLPIDGDMPACPGNVYGLSKEAGELQLRYFARWNPEMSCTAIRFPALVSERYLEYYRHRRRHPGHEHYGNLDEGFSYLALADAGSLIVAILNRQGPGYHQYFPAAPDNHLGISVQEAVEKFYRGVPLRVPLEQMTSLVDISRITRDVGWRPTHAGLFREG